MKIPTDTNQAAIYPGFGLGFDPVFGGPATFHRFGNSAFGQASLSGVSNPLDTTVIKRGGASQSDVNADEVENKPFNNFTDLAKNEN